MAAHEHPSFGVRWNRFCSSGFCCWVHKKVPAGKPETWITMEMNTNSVEVLSAELSPWQIHQNENFLWKHISWQEGDLGTDASLEPSIFKPWGNQIQSFTLNNISKPCSFCLWLPFPLSKNCWKLLKSLHFGWCSCFLIQVITLGIVTEKAPSASL